MLEYTVVSRNRQDVNQTWQLEVGLWNIPLTTSVLAFCFFVNEQCKAMSITKF